MYSVSSFAIVIIGIIWLSDQTISTKVSISDVTFDTFRRIINGYRTDIQWVPYFVYVTVKHGNRLGSCGGSLISSRWIVTAAHCLHKEGRRLPDENIILYAGTSKSDNFDNTVQMRHVILSVVNSHWVNPVKNGISNHDIALLKTCAEMEYTREVQPIVLARSNHQLFDGDEAFACGFGDIKTYGPPIKSLELYSVVLRKEGCFGMKTADTVFCFEGIDSSMSGICHGDSGGPLIILENKMPILIGIAAGTGCKKNIGGGRFTEVPLYRDWIREITGV